MQDATIKAVSKGRRTTLKPYQELLQAWLPKVANKITDFTTGWRRKSGAQPVALEPLRQCDPFTAALLGLRALLDQLGGKRAQITSLSIHIGGLIEHELQIRLWERSEPELFHAARNRLVTSKADHTHIERVNINAFNKLLEEGRFGDGWEKWDQRKKLLVGNEVLNAIVHGTGWFEILDGAEGAHYDQKFLTFRPGMEEWIADRLTKIEECSPSRKPTIIPPKRWNGMRDGGYWTPYIPQEELIGLKRHHLHQSRQAADEVDALEMPGVYEALNFLQETPWRVNKRVLAVVNEMLRLNLSGFAELPDYRGRDMPLRPLIESEEAVTAWKREASRVRGYNALLVSAQISFNRVLQVATEYAAFDRFYFPHKMDFRGRIYPMPVALQPQGSDIARGLLEFAEGKPVTEHNNGAAWLAINLASAWGNDKVSFAERIAWVEANEALWRRIAADPVGTRHEWSTKADKPWQFVAACYDWVGYLEEGFGYVSCVPVSVDGTCNGLQHLSALGRDAAVGERVNLLPGEAPSDVYQYVADAILPTLQRISYSGGDTGELADYWLGLRGASGKLPRSLAKRPVMILAYSATKEAFFKYTLEWMDENMPAGPDEDWRLRYRRASFLRNILWDAVHEALPKATAVMHWLKDCAKLAAIGNQPIFWRTPDGFVCRHFYGKMRSYKVKVQLDGSEFNLRLEEPTKDMDVVKQLLGIAPNFVHSLDATAARGCINLAMREGRITAFASVHDSFGTHAADMWPLYDHLRNAFVEVHEAEVLTHFRNMCVSVMVGHMVAEEGMDPLEASELANEKLPPVPELGSLDIRGVLSSDYFFA